MTGPARDPVPGYRIKRKLGVGGMATVFLAEDVKAGGREVALKILHTQKAADPRAGSSADG